ncbi:MAG: hypothetical protein JNM66_24975 [Bryobacterales bacterium]|nr:hypothetical protein [Bryobacterales bacterium]
MEDEERDFDDINLNPLIELDKATEVIVQKISALIKSHAAGQIDESNFHSSHTALVKEYRSASARTLCETRRLLRRVGISERQLREIERLQDEKHKPTGSAWWVEQVYESRATENLDEMTAAALDSVLPHVDQDWLASEAKKPYRLDEAFRTMPIHVVSGIRVGTSPAGGGPQRFARMILSGIDHLNKHPDFDFHAGAMLVPELAMLGNSLDEVHRLGPEGRRKFKTLPSLPDDIVSSTNFELLVGAACCRRNLDVEMVPENRSSKVPDFRISGLGGIPAAIECKRRLGLMSYELTEARQVEALYAAIRPTLRDRGLHCSIEVTFKLPLNQVSAEDFYNDITSAASLYSDTKETVTSWGAFEIRRLPYCGSIPRTRLYSPDFLRTVFGWNQGLGPWDGILAEVEPPARTLVEKYRSPICLMWRSDSEVAVLKRSRGIVSLWGDAAQQIPDGEYGLIYIAYPEGSRPSIADGRTRHILQSMDERWHRWSVRIPITIINRLYPRAVFEGRPDLIESAIPGAGEGHEIWLRMLPWLVFTKQFQELPGI